MEQTVLKKMGLGLILLTLLGCRESSDEELICPVYMAGEVQDFISVYTNGVLFVKESEPDACYAYAIDYVEEQQQDHKSKDACWYYGPNWHSVDEIRDEFIDNVVDLDEDSVIEMAEQVCSLDNSDFKIDELLSFYTDEEYGGRHMLFFEYTNYGRRYRGNISSYNVSGVVCPLFAINCYVSCNDESGCPVPLPRISR